MLSWCHFICIGEGTLNTSWTYVLINQKAQPERPDGTLPRSVYLTYTSERDERRFYRGGRSVKPVRMNLIALLKRTNQVIYCHSSQVAHGRYISCDAPLWKGKTSFSRRKAFGVELCAPLNCSIHARGFFHISLFFTFLCDSTISLQQLSSVKRSGLVIKY